MKSSYTVSQSAFQQLQLGTDPVTYKSAAHRQFMNPTHQQQHAQPEYKNYNQRVDIITGQVYD